MKITAFDLRENIYALLFAVLGGRTVEQAINETIGYGLTKAEQSQTRRCTRCGLVKPLNEFYMSSYKNKDGIVKKATRQPCKECCRVIEREKYWRENKKRKNNS